MGVVKLNYGVKSYIRMRTWGTMVYETVAEEGYSTDPCARKTFAGMEMELN